ncbi:MAG: XdhC family protein [Gemmatimonadales bacterium]
MNDRVLIWSTARELAERDARGTLVTLARQRGSLPMGSDAKMLVALTGDRRGTVGGGCVEGDVIRQALQVAQGTEPEFARHRLDADSAGDIGLSCGGTVEFFLEPIVASHRMAQLYDCVARAIQDRRHATVYTGADWTDGPCKGAKLGSEFLVVGNVEEVPARSRMSTYFDSATNTLVESIRRVPRVVIFGAGHVGKEIAKVAAGAGFQVTVIDDREEFANPERIPWASEVVAGDFRAVLDKMSFDEDDFVLSTTRGHKFDAYVVERTAGSPARYVGMLGSKRKRKVVLRALEQAGVARDALERVRTPIGLDVGADTPEEIAVSVVAELISVRRQQPEH